MGQARRNKLTGRTYLNNHPHSGSRLIAENRLSHPHVLAGITANGAVLVPLDKVLELYEKGQDSEIALLPCVTLAADGCLVVDHLSMMPVGQTCWFDVVPSDPNPIKSFVGTLSDHGDKAVAFMLAKQYRIACMNLFILTDNQAAALTAVESFR